MTSTTLLRSAAVATGLVGLIDPSWTARRPAPVPVEVKAPADLQRAAGDVRRSLENQLGDRITFDSDAQPAAVVLVGRTGSMTSLDRDGVSISTVSLGSPAPNVRVIAAEDPDPVRVGWTATVGAVVEGVGMAGKASRIVLEQRGVEIAREEHRWKENAERFDARLHYTPPSSGTSTVTLRVLPFEGEAVVTDNAVDLRLAVSERRLNVLVHEPRPSWNAAFVRRSLEQDPSFEVSTIVQASQGPRGPGRKSAGRVDGCRVEPVRRRAHRGTRRVAAIGDRSPADVRPNQGRGRSVPSRPPSCRAISRAHPSEFRQPNSTKSSSTAPSPSNRLRAHHCVHPKSPCSGKACQAHRCWLRLSFPLVGARGQSYSSGPLAQVASSSRERWTRGAFAQRQTTGSGGSGGPGSPRRQPQRRRGSRRPSRQEFLVLVRT